MNVVTEGEYLSPTPKILFDEEGKPKLAGMRCSACGAVFPGARLACGKCGERHELTNVTLAQTGLLHSFTIVHRSFPGANTPFVAVVVDLDGGGCLRGTLLDAPIDPDAYSAPTPVQVVFRDTGQMSPEGKPYLSYYFVLRNGEFG